MRWVAAVLLALGVIFARISFADCPVCDSTCGDWSCITNCSSGSTNPTFDTYRCAVDINGNGQIDGCSELQVCQLVGGRYVCPADLGDRLCTSTNWRGPTLYDLNPNDFDSPVWGVWQTSSRVSFPQYQNLLSQYALDCFPVPSSAHDMHFQFLRQNFSFPVWVCGGALYWDGWFSYNSCSYRSYDGSVWKVKNNACSDPNKIWQRLNTNCYATSWQHTISFRDGSTAWLTWYIPMPQNTFNQTQWFSAGGKNYSVNLRCVNSAVVTDAMYGNQLTLCTTFLQSVYDSRNTLLYQIYWYLNSTWSCPVYGLSQSSSLTYEWLSPASTSQFYAVAFERPNNISAVGVGADMTRNRCKPCSTSMQGLSGGVSKRQDVPEPPPPPPPIQEDTAACVNPRFFSGHARACRAGGITILGASCCGISGLFRNMCNNRERELRKMRQADLCTYVGEFCSKRWRVGFVRICIERSRSYCCFNSRLARILQECGRPQIGKGWGDPRSPNCSGYTIDEFSRVDFTSESCVQAIEMWANQIAQSVGESIVSNIASQVNDRVQWWINNAKNTKDYGGEK